MNELRAGTRSDVDELSEHVLRRAAGADTLDGRFAARELRRRAQWVRDRERARARERRRHRLRVWRNFLAIAGVLVALDGAVVWGILWLANR